MAPKLATHDKRTGATPHDRLLALPPERRALLLDSAEDEFAALGFAGASLNRILARAGMSKGQAYYYIADKADLYRAVIGRALARLTAQMEFSFGTPADTEAFWRQASALFTRITAVLLQDDRLAALASGIYESAKTRAALASANTSVRTGAAGLVALGQSLGAVRSDMPETLLVDALFGMMLEMDRWLAVNWRSLDEAEALRLSEAMFTMLRAAAAPAKE